MRFNKLGDFILDRLGQHVAGTPAQDCRQRIIRILRWTLELDYGTLLHGVSLLEGLQTFGDFFVFRHQDTPPFNLRSSTTFDHSSPLCQAPPVLGG